MNPLLSPHATENNCIKVGGPGLKCSVMLDPKSCPGKCKTAVQIKKHFEKARVRQNAQIIKGNSDSTGLRD